MLVAVDANIIMSALLGGKPSTILFDSRFHFITTEFTISEVIKYLPRLSKKTKLTIEDLTATMYLLPIQQYDQIQYRPYLSAAKRMMNQIDPKDVDLLALALKFDVYLWSQDKDFDQAGYPKLLKTYQFF